MIKVTRLNGMDLYINAELIEFIESTPDTVLTLTTGKKFVLKDSVDDVVNRVIKYKQTVGDRIICHIENQSIESINCDD